MDIVDEVLEKLKITVYTIEFYVNFKLVNLNLATISYSLQCVFRRSAGIGELENVRVPKSTFVKDLYNSS